MLKKFTTYLSQNKSVLGRKVLIIGGTVIGGVIAVSALNKLNAAHPDAIVAGEFVNVEETESVPE